MWKKRFEEILQDCDNCVVQIILGVLAIEQEYISMQRPHVKEPIDSLIAKIAEEALKEEVPD